MRTPFLSAVAQEIFTAKYALCQVSSFVIQESHISIFLVKLHISAPIFILKHHINIVHIYLPISDTRFLKLLYQLLVKKIHVITEVHAPVCLAENSCVAAHKTIMEVCVKTGCKVRYLKNNLYTQRELIYIFLYNTFNLILMLQKFVIHTFA